MTAGPRVLLIQLSERTSAKGNAYLSGWLGKASVVAFRGEEPDRWGNPVWNVYVSEPEPRPEAGQERDPARRPQARPEAKSPNFGGSAVGRAEAKPNNVGLSANFAGSASGDAPANPSARPVERGDGWRGPSAYRRGNGAVRASAAGHEPFHDDSLEDIGR